MKRILIFLLAILPVFANAQEEDWGTQLQKQIENITLTVKKSGAITVEDFALSFAKTVFDSEARQQLRNYMLDREKFNAENKIDDEMHYSVEMDVRNGYIYCGNDHDELEIVLWKKNNGHRLVGISMFMCNNSARYTVGFFDWNPSSRIIKPDTKINSLFWGWFKDTFLQTVSLPKTGRDITVVGENKDKCGKFTLLWNGKSFTRTFAPMDE